MCKKGSWTEDQRIPFGEVPAGAKLCKGSAGVTSGNNTASARNRAVMAEGADLRYDTPMDWTAVYDGERREVVITATTGRSQYYGAQPGSAVAERKGITRKDSSLVELLNADLTPCKEGYPAFLRRVESDSSALLFSVDSGEVVSTRTSAGAVIMADYYREKVRINKHPLTGKIESIWSEEEGVLLVAREMNKLTLSWYPPDQIMEKRGYSYSVKGVPYKTYSYENSIAPDGSSITKILNQGIGQSSYQIMRYVTENSVVIKEGMGDEIIVTKIIHNKLPDARWEEIITVGKEGDRMPTSSVRTVKKYTDGGWLTVSRTEGYNTPQEQTDTYVYNNAYRLSLEVKANGNYTRYEYDSMGRVVWQATPWSDGSTEKVVRTTYSDQRFNDYRPVLVRECFLRQDGVEVEFARSTYSYEDTPSVSRTTIVKSAQGRELQPQIHETWGELSACPYARGRVRLEQAVNGVQELYTYETTNLHGSCWMVVREVLVNGQAVPGRSRREIRYLNSRESVLRKEDYVHTGGGWRLIASEIAEYDLEGRKTKAVRANGRVSTAEWMCCGPLREVNEDGIMTSYGYDSAQQLIEVIRSETETTPETVISYVRDAEGRVLIERTDIGPMSKSVLRTYDKLGRVASMTDELGRLTTYTYELNGRRERVTLPTGAEQVTERNRDDSLRSLRLPGEYPLDYVYEVKAGITASSAFISGTSHRAVSEEYDGLGRRSAVFLTRAGSEADYFEVARNSWNSKNQLEEKWDRGVRKTFKYDIMGELSDDIQPRSATPTPYNSPYAKYAYEYESNTDEVYRKTTVTTYNEKGNPLTSTREDLVSDLSAILENKTIETDIYGNATATWREYDGATKKKVLSSIPTSSITAETLVADGFTVSQKDHVGVVTTWSRTYTVSGSKVSQIDGRGNEETEVRDIVGRISQVTDAAGNITTIAYDFASGQAAILTDALGKTACYKYDIYGRKTAEYGTAVYPVCFGYDDASNLIRLVTFRCTNETIMTDPSSRTDGDITEWIYAWQEKLALKKIYADGSSVITQYGSMNRIFSVMNAKEQTVNYTYDGGTGLLKSQLYSDNGTPNIYYFYNYLGWLVKVIDGLGTRELTYDTYGRADAEIVTIQGTKYDMRKHYDVYGRSSGHELIQGEDTSVLYAVQGYGTDDRLVSAGLRTAAGIQTFYYSYLSGTHLVKTLMLPNGIIREQFYEDYRDLPTQLLYKKDSENIVSRTQTYDFLGRVSTRTQQRGTESMRNDTFTYNSRSELTKAIMGIQNYSYNYDNIGNRKNVEEVTENILYDTNNLNQYTAITEKGSESFLPFFGADGNQIKVKTETGIWDVTYNAIYRPVKFTQGSMVVECGYDYMGRRWYKKEIQNGTIVKHESYLYRGYLRIAAMDMLNGQSVISTLLWDPVEEFATRPLMLICKGKEYYFLQDLNKNVTELLDSDGKYVTAYDYSPYGKVSLIRDFNAQNTIQWSSEIYDKGLSFVYYNYRYYNPCDGRWICRDNGEDDGYNLYNFLQNDGINYIDILGEKSSFLYKNANAARAIQKQLKNNPKNKPNSNKPPKPSESPATNPTEYTPPQDPNNKSPIGRSKLEDILDATDGGGCYSRQYKAALRQCESQRSKVKCPKCCIIATYCKPDPWNKEYYTQTSVGRLSPVSCSDLQGYGTAAQGSGALIEYLDI